MVKLENVTFHYGQESEGTLLTGVNDISFKIEKGKCAILCGRSGAGKSTILHLISGLVPGFYEGQLSGQVTVNNGFPGSFTPEQKVETLGVVFQDPRSQFFMGKVLDEIAFSAENIGLNPEQILPQVTACAKRLDIEPLLGKKVNELSSGQKQRVAIGSYSTEISRTSSANLRSHPNMYTIEMRIRGNRVPVYSGASYTLRFTATVSGFSGGYAGYRSDNTTICELLRLGDAWTYEPYERFDVEMPDGTSASFGSHVHRGICRKNSLRLMRQPLPQILLWRKICLLALFRQVKGQDGMRRTGFSGF